MSPNLRPPADLALFTVTDTEVEIHYGAFTDRHPAAWAALLAWVEFHDIEPRRVPLCSRIVRNVAECRVEYDEFVVGADGAKVIAGDGDDTLMLVTRRMHSQGECPPLPWPPEVWEAAR